MTVRILHPQRIYIMRNYQIEAGFTSLMEKDPADDRPREKLERLGIEALSDKELLMLLVGSGSARRGVEDLAQEILTSLDKNPRLSAADIMKVAGIGIAKASAIGAALELGRRRISKRAPSIANPADIYREIRHFSSREQENLIVVMLNGAHEVIGAFVATVGLLNRTIVHPREVFAPAIRERAAAVAIAHNHPSGNVMPSEEDKDVTARLKKAGEILGIKLLDHIVFSDERYYSFLEHGLM